MKTYLVTLKVSGSVSVEVEADNKKCAVEEAIASLELGNANLRDSSFDAIERDKQVPVTVVD